jgi:hypothetical protein
MSIMMYKYPTLPSQNNKISAGTTEIFRLKTIPNNRYPGSLPDNKHRSTGIAEAISNRWVIRHGYELIHFYSVSNGSIRKRL